jgi:hypothetical protein
VTDEPLEAEAERGLPDRRGEITTSLPWVLRFVLAAAIGAAVGFIASFVFARGVAGAWTTAAGLASAATLLSIRKTHAWHLSTFADGVLVGLVAWPILAFLTVVFVWRAAAIDAFPFAALRSVGFLIILLPTGWVTGFVYHLLLSAAERARSRKHEDNEPS